MIAAGVTSYAGGSAGHDPIRVGRVAKARGLTPNVHLTCVEPRAGGLLSALDGSAHAGNRKCLSRSPAIIPRARRGNAADSVAIRCSWWNHRRAARQGGWPFYISVAVSPFKYLEDDCAYQYLKLEKKIAAGADFAITQLGFDSRKFRELKRYLDERGLKTPIFGNVYVLPPKQPSECRKGEPPGCWVSPELLAKIQEEAEGPDKGMAARLERAAQWPHLRGPGLRRSLHRRRSRCRSHSMDH